MEVGEVPKGIRWSAEAGGPPKVRIGGVSSRGRGPTSYIMSFVSHFDKLQIYPCILYKFRISKISHLAK